MTLDLDRPVMTAQHARMPRFRGHHTVERLAANALRDFEVLQRYEAGETLAGIGAAVGLTRERIRQIVKASGAPMPWDYKCAVKGCDTSPRTPNLYCSFHQVRFERFGDPLGNMPRLMDQHGTLASYKRGRCSCELCRKRNADRVREYQHRIHPEMRRYKARGS
jgi:hypothetical protein